MSDLKSDNKEINVVTRSDIFEISRSHYKLRVEAGWHYFALFRLLQLSPSYWQVHCQRTGAQMNSRELPDEWQQVLATYDMLGPVWQVPFWEWWLDRAQFCFSIERKPAVQLLGLTPKLAHRDADLSRALGEAVSSYYGNDVRLDGSPPTALLAVSLNGTKREIMGEIEKLLDNQLSTPVFVEPAAQYKILKSKLRRTTINVAIRVAQARAHFHHLPLYVAGNRAKVSATHETDESADANYDDKRRSMAFLTSRHIRRAYLLSENAARGNFPSMEPPKPGAVWPEFDFPLMKQNLLEYERISTDAFNEMPPEARSYEYLYSGRNRTIRY